MKVKNCDCCGQLFHHSGRTICPDCYHSPAQQQERILAFLRHNGGHGTVEEAAVAAGVPKSVVLAMISQGWFQDKKKEV